MQSSYDLEIKGIQQLHHDTFCYFSNGFFSYEIDVLNLNFKLKMIFNFMRKKNPPNMARQRWRVVMPRRRRRAALRRAGISYPCRIGP